MHLYLKENGEIEVDGILKKGKFYVPLFNASFYCSNCPELKEFTECRIRLFPVNIHGFLSVNAIILEIYPQIIDENTVEKLLLLTYKN